MACQVFTYFLACSNHDDGKAILDESFANASLLANLIFYLTLSFLFLYILYVFEKSKMELPLQLEKQIADNRQVLPFILVSSLLCYLLIILFSIPSVIQILTILDASINNLSMFRLIHCNDWSKHIIIDDITSDSEEGREDSNEETSDRDEVRYIMLDGFHPFPVRKHVLDDHDLWSKVITDAIILRSINKYYRSGLMCIPSLNICSSTINELNEQVESQMKRTIFYE